MTPMEARKDAEDSVFYEIEKAKTEGANLLLPSTHISGLSEFHAPVLERVLLSANPQDGDVYAHDNDKDGPKKKWRPTKQALMKLSVCAGVIWSVNESRRLDNGANRDYIAYRAVGGIKKADGQPVFFSADYDLDFEVMEEELQELYEKKAARMTDKSAKDRAEYIEYCVKRDMLQKRKFKLRLCEAGAMNRVLRMLLGIKQAYTTEELQKPFVMARIVFRPDFTDKSVRDRFIDASIKAMTGVYGPGAAAPSRTEKTEPIDVTPIPEEEKPEAEPENGNHEGEAGDPNTSLLADFEACSLEEKEKAILRLADKKGYGVTAYLTKCQKKKLTELTAETMTNLFRHLLSLADMTASDQIPF